MLFGGVFIGGITVHVFDDFLLTNHVQNLTRNIFFHVIFSNAENLFDIETNSLVTHQQCTCSCTCMY